ncbi:MAG: EF-hand domain-containing protein [Gammaproteobacteria bacterium]
MEKKLLTVLALTLASSVAFAMEDMSSSSTDAKVDASATSTTGVSSAHPGMAGHPDMTGSSAAHMAASFDAIDTNKDGSISRSEYDAHMQGAHMKGSDADTTMSGSGADMSAPGIQVAPQSPGTDGKDPGVGEQDTAQQKPDQ